MNVKQVIETLDGKQHADLDAALEHAETHLSNMVGAVVDQSCRGEGVSVCPAACQEYFDFKQRMHTRLMRYFQGDNMAALVACSQWREEIEEIKDAIKQND